MSSCLPWPRVGGGRDRDRPAPGEVAGRGHGRNRATRSMLSKEKKKKKASSRVVGGGMWLLAETSEGRPSPGAVCVRGRPGLWRQADRRVSPGKAHQGSGSGNRL